MEGKKQNKKTLSYNQRNAVSFLFSAQPQLNGQPTLPPPASNVPQNTPVYNLSSPQNTLQQQQAPVDLEDVALYPQTDDMGKSVSLQCVVSAHLRTLQLQQASVVLEDVALCPHSDDMG